jgi:hypothetical protein
MRKAVALEDGRDASPTPARTVIDVLRSAMMV